MGASLTADAMVTARVPRGVKEQGDALLRKLGQTPTKLVNAAYCYLIRHESLPGESESERPVSGKRTLSPQQLSAFTDWLGDVTVGTLDVGDKTFDQLKEEAMCDRYPDLFLAEDMLPL